MPKKLGKFLIIVLAAFTVIFIYGLDYGLKAASIASAYNAKILCSDTFISKRKPEDIINSDLSQFNYVGKSVDYDDKSVTASVFGLGKSKAIYREGLGCTLVLGDVTEQDLRTQFTDNIPELIKSDKTQELENVSNKLPKEINKIKLDDSINKAFIENNPESPKITRAVVVLYKGKIISEKYSTGITEKTPLLGWSMTKSITNALVGILVKQGKININDDDLFSEWRYDQRKNISIDSLMKMSSGLKFDEEYGSISDVTKMLFTKSDTAEYALNKPLKVKPDTQWSYSSGTTNIISKIIKRTIGVHNKDYILFPYQQLFHKIGMNSAVIEPDASGTFIGSSFMYATARDWAKFGQLYLQNGIWNNEKIFPDNWIKYTTTPAPKSEEQYGAQFWLNKGKKWSNLPDDIYYADGFEGQGVIICPSYNTVIVRLGLSKKKDSWNLPEFLENVLSAIPKNQ